MSRILIDKGKQSHFTAEEWEILTNYFNQVAEIKKSKDHDTIYNTSKGWERLNELMKKYNSL